MSNDKKVKSISVLNAITLESSEASTQAATSRVIVDTYLSDQINLACKYTTGASETGTTCYLKVWGYIGAKPESTSYPYAATTNSEIASDTDNWIQLGTYNIDTGTATFTKSLFKIAGGAGATVYDAHFAQGITFSKIRVSAYESGVSSNEGTLTAVVLIQ
jgi:hypothetical protein